MLPTRWRSSGARASQCGIGSLFFGGKCFVFLYPASSSSSSSLTSCCPAVVLPIGIYPALPSSFFRSRSLTAYARARVLSTRTGSIKRHHHGCVLLLLLLMPAEVNDKKDVELFEGTPWPLLTAVGSSIIVKAQISPSVEGEC